MSIYSKIIDLQKLQAAWKRVRKNKPAAGVDHISCEQFEQNLTEELKSLHAELKTHAYEPLPVKRVILYKGEKVRGIVLHAMRDKVMQQSVSIELNKLFDHRLSTQTYAYRPDKSALNAVAEIEKSIMSGKYRYALKMDITSFFDEIRWEVLELKLKEMIREEDVIGLIRQSCRTRILDETTGELEEVRNGIHQGSSISPVLSNVYLMEFDLWMQGHAPCYFRYADDILVLGKTQKELKEVLQESSLKLQELGLRLNEKKSVCIALAKGVEYLGYHFDANGKSVPAKATEHLVERLESVWLLNADLSFEEKIKKVLEITGGWEQYYRGERELLSIFEYVSLMYTAGEKEDVLQKLKEGRGTVNNIYKDIMQYLSGIWQEKNENKLELLEYEQYFQLPDSEHNIGGSAELMSFYHRFLIEETKETAIELMQCYTDMHEYEKAAYWQKKAEALQTTAAYGGNRVIRVCQEDGFGPFYNERTPRKVLQTLVGREDIYSIDELESDDRRKTSLQTLPLTEKVIRAHLAGNVTVGTYIRRPNDTVKYIVVDVDVSKSVLLQHDRNSGMFHGYLKNALRTADEICKRLEKMGLRGYIEYSGFRGYHVWLFLSEWISVRYANMFCELLEAEIKEEENITIEMFPNKTHLKPGKFGQALKLPYGIHIKTGEYACFLDDDLNPIADINLFLDGIAQFPVASIKKVLATHTGKQAHAVTPVIDTDLTPLGELDANITAVLSRCGLMRHLCLKAYKTSYLPHFERLTLLYVFGHMGEAGESFLHHVMSFTLNYSYNTTERFIRKKPEKPVSCVKLRDQYKKITAETGCNCVFRQAKNCYPSPVLHAISNVNEAEGIITLPTSRTMTKEKEKVVLDEMNIHRKAQNLAKQIQDYRKQKRGIEKNIKKCENDLLAIFEQAGTDRLEVDMGMLVRRKTEHGYEWMIEI